ncbi:MAG TPA: segregation/condensation protein A, partial [Candidatus Polarisedimenticolia bacterium]|nr:segregation/condensation protein A [Candidatus Polarisedimenticolia bacterium]
GLRRAAEHLQEREAVMELVFPRPADRVAEFAGEQGIEADLFALLRAFQAILQRAGQQASARVTRERISLAERITWLIETLQRERRVTFRALFEDAVDRLACILTFLALLEVMRLRLARAYPGHRDADIVIVLAEDPSPPPADAPEPQPHA